MQTQPHNPQPEPSECWQAKVTYSVQGWVAPTVTVTEFAATRLQAGQAVNRFMLGLRSECSEVSRDIRPVGR